MTYNVHRCVGLDRQLSIARIVDVIASCKPDVVALQELDVRRARTDGEDQAHRIAQALDMVFHFNAALEVEEEQYGDAVLSRFPMDLIKACALPTPPSSRLLEPRGALWVGIELPGQRLQVLNTHLGLRSKERMLQANALLGPGWLGDPRCVQPTVLCGDFNATPYSGVCRTIGRRMHDAQAGLVNHRPKSTWISRYPFLRIDHIFVDESIGVRSAWVPDDKRARVASDHLPLIADLVLPGQAVAR